MKEIGKMTCNMVKEQNNGQMELNMKVSMNKAKRKEEEF